VILADLDVSVGNERIDDLGVSLNQTCHVWIGRGFHYTDALAGLLDLHRDLLCVRKHGSKERITHVDRTTFLDPPVHRLDVLPNDLRNFRVVRFGECLHAVVELLYLASD